MNKQKLIKFLNAEIDRISSDLRDIDEYDYEAQGELASFQNGLSYVLDAVEKGEFDG